jgi:ABC-type transport system substrate-binding protein
MRSAWAELLRDHLDMLYDVGTDALDSFDRSNKISVFTYVRPYQYVLVFNTQKGAFRSPQVRNALSQAIDSDAIVRDGLNGHGVPSSGPIWPHHWASASAGDRRLFNPSAAAKTLAGHHADFTCLVPADYERLALVVKRQFQAVGVSMDVKELPPDEIYAAMARHDFDATLFDLISGPSVFRLQRIWHSGEVNNPSGFSSTAVDAALDTLRRAPSDEAYRTGVTTFERAMITDPPAIFLAWSQRARAVSKRFVVPEAETGRDILSTLRLWKPAVDQTAARRN